MQRLFTTFPGGWPGLGLLLLRAAVAITAIMEGAGCLAEHGDQMIGTWIVGSLEVAGGVLLLIGFLTLAAFAGVGSAGISLSWFPSPALNLFDAKLPAVFAVIVAAAIVLLGPGAFSLDVRLFGRREIIIPPRSR